jgi:hypothetical protein
VSRPGWRATVGPGGRLLFFLAVVTFLLVITVAHPSSGDHHSGDARGTPSASSGTQLSVVSKITPSGDSSGSESRSMEAGCHFLCLMCLFCLVAAVAQRPARMAAAPLVRAAIDEPVRIVVVPRPFPPWLSPTPLALSVIRR